MEIEHAGMQSGVLATPQAGHAGLQSGLEFFRFASTPDCILT